MSGYYVQRNAAGDIVALFAREQPFIAEEFLPADHPDVLGFLNAG